MNFRLSFAALAALGLFAPAPVVRAQSAVMVPVKQFVNGFNKGDSKSSIAACEDDLSIVDDFAPYEWHGKGAMTRWLQDIESFAKKNGVSEERVTLGKDWHSETTGDRAYLVIPITVAYKMKGKPMKDRGVFTIALHKGSTGWRISAWSFAKH